MLTKILRLLCVSLLILIVFLIISSITASKKPSLIDGAKQTVIDHMHQPKAADMRDVKFHASGRKMSSKVVGDVCGEVFTFKDENPYKYKRFIVQVASDDKGECVFSAPLFDFEGEMMREEDFQDIWDARCK
ncbi:hypothetical protein [Providencia rettgeri]|uniref:hypothetical protein n=1 Tax=Providencia rettgeri TaxID=587 RepID=UPI0023AB0C60|nr:hypothetical protein [Providencia rettgeri]